MNMKKNQNKLLMIKIMTLTSFLSLNLPSSLLAEWWGPCKPTIGNCDTDGTQVQVCGLHKDRWCCTMPGYGVTLCFGYDPNKPKNKRCSGSALQYNCDIMCAHQTCSPSKELKHSN